MSVSVHHVFIFGTPLSPVQSLMRPVTMRASEVSMWELTEDVAQESMILLRGVQASPVNGMYRFLRVRSEGISPYLKTSVALYANVGFDSPGLNQRSLFHD